ncbi:MAG: hypothetical protein M3Q71_07980 [Chloroflexota bacterium]|nr:hypothetical protein [Chloroflexota bacterium]
MTNRDDQQVSGGAAGRTEGVPDDPVIGSGDVTKLSDAGAETGAGADTAAERDERSAAGGPESWAVDAFREPETAPNPGREGEAPLGAAGGTSVGAAEGDAGAGAR